MTVIKITPKRLSEIPGLTPQNKKSAATTVMRHPTIDKRVSHLVFGAGSGGGSDSFMDGVFYGCFVTQSLSEKFFCSGVKWTRSERK